MNKPVPPQQPDPPQTTTPQSNTTQFFLVFYHILTNFTPMTEKHNILSLLIFISISIFISSN